jgi:2-dehydro-3-deoxy-D-arabinonate dehydratase
MHLLRYVAPSGRPVLGVARDGYLTPLSPSANLGDLLRMSASDLRDLCEEAVGGDVPVEGLRLLPPVDARMEVWAAGVTYRRSRAARVQESDSAGSVYELVYGADRPELFFKSAAWRVTGHEEQISVRRDSEVSVPEPELALVLNGAGERVGYTVCNDVSSRSIEGANPLYLPQAKVYLGSCAVGPGIRPAWDIDDPYALCIRMVIERGGATIWEGSASTSELRRDLDDLAGYLFREEIFPDGVVLATGTSLVPELPFTLLPGDTVTIEVEQVGILQSRVVAGKADMAWLADSADAPGRRPTS